MDEDLQTATEINSENAAAAIIAKADEIVEEAVTAYERSQDRVAPSARATLNYLIRKEVWDQLTQQLGLDPDELREAADTLEEEAEAEEGEWEGDALEEDGADEDDEDEEESEDAAAAQEASP